VTTFPKKKGRFSMALDRQTRTRISRMGGLARSAGEPDGTAMTAKARKTFWDAFYDQTDPELPEAERQRQAHAARKLHMTQLSHKAAQKRSAAARAAAEAAEATEAELAALATYADAV
jgi:hypothetical protein